jgi:hypothetical protein
MANSKYKEFGRNVGADLIPPEDVMVNMGRQPERRAKRLTKPSLGIKMIGGEKEWILAGDEVVIDEEQPSGFTARCMVHISRLRKIK